MDLDRTSVGDRPQRQRATATPQQEPLGPQQDAPQPVQPDHGGPLAASRDQEPSPLEPGDRGARKGSCELLPRLVSREGGRPQASASRARSEGSCELPL